jgi:murein L,D-transpeptidase YcbB/YkuD
MKRIDRCRPGVRVGLACGLLKLVGLSVALLSVPAYSDPLLQGTVDSISDARTVAIDGVPLLSGRLLREFYAARGYSLAWDDRSRIDALLEVVEQSRGQGFDPEDFHFTSVRRLSLPGVVEGLSRAERLGADLVLSDALVRYVHHHRYGKLDPVAIDPKWHDRAPVSSEVLLTDLREALAAEDLKASLTERFPKPFWYEQLMLALQRYQTHPHLATLPPLPAGANLGQGSRSPRVALLRERLYLLDGQAHLSSDPEQFDQSLQSAVEAFQRRSGLTPDGVVGPATVAALNAYGDASKADLIRINLERMRWLYQDLPQDYVFVDVAGFKVQLARGNAFVWSTRAIVGTPETQTPMFRDTMDHLVFNPTWTVPPSIQKKMGRVSGDYRVVDRQTGQRVSGGDVSNHRRYRLIQEPGPKNALGRVKFMFPNHHAIYLHDTPAKALFGRQTRTLSNGCVRVQNPLELAEAILGQPNWDQAVIERVVEGGRTRYVNLAQTLPVLLYYLTAYADEQGRVGFRKDVYDRDEALRDAFAVQVLRARIAFPEPAEPTVPVIPDPPDRPEPEHTAPPTAVRVTLSASQDQPDPGESVLRTELIKGSAD